MRVVIYGCLASTLALWAFLANPGYRVQIAHIITRFAPEFPPFFPTLYPPPLSFSRLEGIIHRRHYSVLKDELPAKYEYVLRVKMTPVQIALYNKYGLLSLFMIGHESRCVFSSAFSLNYCFIAVDFA